MGLLGPLSGASRKVKAEAAPLANWASRSLLGIELSESALLQFDDTNPRVIEMIKMVKGNFEMKKDKKVKESKEGKKRNAIIDVLEEEFGRFSERADGKGLQKNKHYLYRWPFQ
ncbi:MAG TPA: hypothetical protein VI754_07200 [Bacteriovoracaceae bacterium]|nr:hypothetical protein [Bacteriovoracaceae bacterium]